MRLQNLSLILTIGLLLASCAYLVDLFSANLQKEKEDRFLQATDHELLKIYSKEEKLGYVYDKGTLIKRVWGGEKIVQPTGQSIKLTYTRNDFDKLKLLLGDDLSVGPGLENVHHIIVYLEDIHKYELTNIQPLIEYTGKESEELLQRPFIVSMLKVTKLSIHAYQKFAGEFGAEYRPYPLVKLRGASGSSTQRGEEQVGYNIFVGYRLYDGSKWVQDFESMPKLDVWIVRPDNSATIDGVRVRIVGTVLQYRQLQEEYQNRLRLYLMVRDEYDDQWLLQPKARIDTEGRFESIVRLGTLEKGDGHRYSIAVFATYFEINRKVNSVIPFLPFNKGKYIINVTRRDNFDS